MENNEMLEQTNEAENVDTQTTEETEEGIELTDTANATEETSDQQNAEEKEEVKKTLKELLRENPEYQEEYNNMLKIRLDREDRKYQKELSKYQDTDNVLRTTLKLKDGEDTNAKLREYYEAEGIKLPEATKPGLSSRQIEILAKAEAEEIIDLGYDAMVSEANRLAEKKYENLNASEKVIFNSLAEKLNSERDKKSLLKLGAKEELLSDANFIKFRKQFNSNVPMEDIYSLYKSKDSKTKPANPGSMKGIKEPSKKTFYTDEEISKLTSEDLDNPEVWDAVRKSMTHSN